MSESIWTHVKKPWLSHELPISLVRFGHLFLPHCHSCHIIMACLIIACLIMTHWHLIMLALETPSCSRLVLIPLNKPFPLEKSKRILKVLSIIGFITPYSRMMQALYHLGQGNNLPSQLLNLIFLRLMLLVIICSTWGGKPAPCLGFTPFLCHLFLRALTHCAIRINK